MQPNVEVSAKTRKGLTKVFETAVEFVLESRGEGSTATASTSSGTGKSSGKKEQANKKRCLLM